jgi:hypothetical protein
VHGSRLRERIWISYGWSSGFKHCKKEFGTWEYVTGMTGRSWMENRGVGGHEVAMSDLRDFSALAN